MMENLLKIVENEQASEFYPTPKPLVEKMLEGIKNARKGWQYNLLTQCRNA